jgi:pyrimidine-nucleoside phosphorylase
MAIWFRGMNPDEIAQLTQAMRTSGAQFNFKDLNAPRIDKHSTGGVGDKTTLIIGPILAAAEVYVPMIAGRGLGHTGGTLDKLESIPGFRVNLARTEFTELIKKNYFALMGQTTDICPADRKLYALRDVTSTVDSLPLICGSIMSKKLSEDLTGLVLDVKFGSGAFMKTPAQAIELAQLLKSTGEKNGVRVAALITNMNEPLGRFVGNALEVQECHEILQNKKFIFNDHDLYHPTRELSLRLSGYMIWLAGKAENANAGYERAQELLENSKALLAFEKFLKYQGPADITKLPKANFSLEITSPQSGYIQSMNCEQIGLAGIELGAGRLRASDKIDYTAGIEVLVRIGDKITPGQPLFRIFAHNDAPFSNAKKMLLESLSVSDGSPSEHLPLIAQVLT